VVISHCDLSQVPARMPGSTLSVAGTRRRDLPLAVLEQVRGNPHDALYPIHCFMQWMACEDGSHPDNRVLM